MIMVSKKSENQGVGKSKLLLVIIVLLVVIIGLMVFVVFKSPSIGSDQEAQNAGQEVTQSIDDIKTTLTQIKEGLGK